MRIIPDEVYQRLMNNNVPQPVIKAPISSSPGVSGGTRVFSEEEIMNDPTLSDETKWRLLQTQMHRMFETLKKNRVDTAKPVKVSIEKNSEEEEEEEDKKKKKKLSATPTAVGSDKTAAAAEGERLPFFIEWIPAVQRIRALKLVQFLNECQGIEWSEHGRVSIDGEPIPYSQIAELVKYTLKAAGEKPTGWREFSEFLQASKVPKSLVGNKALKSALDSPYPSSSPSSLKTPLRSPGVTSSTPSVPQTRGRKKKRKIELSPPALSPNQNGTGKGKGKRSCWTRYKGGRNHQGAKTDKRGRRRQKCTKVQTRGFRWKTFG